MCYICVFEKQFYMKKLSFIFRLVLVAFLLTFAVDKGYASDGGLIWPDSLNTAKEASYLTGEEKAVILEMNKVRTNPKAYADYLKMEKQYYDGMKVKKPGLVILLTNEGIAAVDECIEYLEKAEPQRMLYPDEALYKAARDLAKEQSQNGETGHEGKDGTDFADRVNYHSEKAYRSLGENISYGRDKAFDILLQLLIDDGVPSRGHRVNIMSPDYEYCGVAIAPHPLSGYVCLIDYAAFFETKKK